MIYYLHGIIYIQPTRPDPRTLDEYTPRQYWSANFIYTFFSYFWYCYCSTDSCYCTVEGYAAGHQLCLRHAPCVLRVIGAVISHAEGVCGASDRYLLPGVRNLPDSKYICCQVLVLMSAAEEKDEDEDSKKGPWTPASSD